jgi:CRISPR-associated protein Cas2
MRTLVLAAYDIACPRRRRHALNLCTGLASGGQKSVHECWVTPAERRHLEAGLASICDPRRDRWMVSDLGPAPLVRTFGRARPPRRPSPVMVFG